MTRRKLAALSVAAIGGAALVAAAPAAHADPTSGVDTALFRPSIDTSGVFSLEGARLMPRRDLAWRLWTGYAVKPLSAAVPGIGGVGDTTDDIILDYALTFDLTFGFTLTQKLAIGFDVAAYRTSTGEGYGERGRYDALGSTPSTGIISLRELSNFDPSGGFEPQSLAGPLDVRLVAKYALVTQEKLAVTLMASAGIPFGEDEVFLGDHGFVLEPRLLVDYRFDQVHATKLVFNVGARIRDRSVIQAYDPNAPDATPDDAQVVLDVGSEIVAGVGANVELASNIVFGAEAVGFVPLPSSMAIGTCTLYSGAACSTLEDADYFNGGGAGDLAAYAMAGITYRVNPHVAVNILGGAGLVGDRRDDLRVTGGITWAPQPKDVARIGRGDTDGDGLPDVSDACPEDTEDKDGYQDDDGCPDVDNDGDGVVDANDACPDEPEDRDGFQDDDGCPERDNDNDGITDVADRCPDQAEDKDGFEDDDGCPDEDNDGDGFPDAEDRCPNEAETVNGVDDDDGCPDTRAQTGPEEGTDRINLKGNKIEFSGRSSNLTNASKVILGQVAQLITSRGLAIRIEVHVPLGTTSKNKSTIAKQQKKDKALTDSRAQAIVNELVKAGVPAGSVQGVGLGSTRPFGNSPPTDPLNERVDFIKTQLRSP